MAKASVHSPGLKPHCLTVISRKFEVIHHRARLRCRNSKAPPPLRSPSPARGIRGDRCAGMLGRQVGRWMEPVWPMLRRLGVEAHKRRSE